MKHTNRLNQYPRSSELAAQVPLVDIQRCLVMLTASAFDAADLDVSSIHRELSEWRQSGTTTSAFLAKVISMSERHEMEGFMHTRRGEPELRIVSFKRARALGALAYALDAPQDPLGALRDTAYEAIAAMLTDSGVMATLQDFVE